MPKQIPADLSIGEGPATRIGSLIADISNEFSKRILDSLHGDIEESDPDEPQPTKESVELFGQVTEQISRAVALPLPGLKSAAFLESNAVLALVLQSISTDRRMTCRISGDADVYVTLIDEVMRTQSVAVSESELHRLTEFADWVMNRH